MIGNVSRIAQFQECRQKAWNWDELGLMSHREADPLMYGEATHEGHAHIFSTGDISGAVKKSEEVFRKRLEGQIILPEELPDLERQIEQVKRGVAMFGEQYARADFQVLWPEVKFMVALPNTMHHCFFIHRILHPGIPLKECIDSRCEHPHYLTGRTDAVMKHKDAVWLLETKTTAMTGDLFFNRFFMDFQPTAYLYGIWKATGVQPHGFFLNVVKKPNKRAADQFNIGFEREAFLRSTEDLLDFERDFTMLVQDYESAWVNKRIYKNTKSCMNYNRKCYYFDRCMRHQEDIEGEFRQRPMDYVQLSYYELLGLPIPQMEEVTPQDV